MRYEDMTIELFGWSIRNEDGRRIGRHEVRVLQSPAGEMTPEEAVAVEYDDKELQRSLTKLERRELDGDGLISLGRTLAALLLPISTRDNLPSVRELFARSLLKVGPDDGLRLRLRTPRDLAVIPWEYGYVDRSGGNGMDGFVALDPRVAIVRHEVLKMELNPPQLIGDISDIKVVCALASADGLPELDLEDEMKSMVEALGSLEGIQMERCEHATLEKLETLIPGAGVFHFAGHGDFKREMGERPGTYTGTGRLAFEDESVDAEQLGINLQGHGVRLAVLGGCQTGRRDGVSVWSGIAPALVNVQIPAVVANQYTIKDSCAIAFSRRFYQALAGGLPIERAVAAGRLAAYNKDKEGRDWGVPVLYMRAGDGYLFGGAADPAARRRSREDAEVDVSLRVKEVAAGGKVLGAEVREMLAGKLAVAVNVDGTVYGDVTGGQLDRIAGGTIAVNTEVHTVGRGGSVTGIKIDSLGFDYSKRPPRATQEKPPAPSKSATMESEGEAEETQASQPTVGANVKVGNLTGGQVIGTQVNQRGDIVYGNKVNVASGGEATLNMGVGGENVQIESVTIYQGAGASREPIEPAVEEMLRLDVALPNAAVVDEPFDVVIAVRQPDAPILAVADLERVVSAEGSIFRTEESEIVKYRIEVTGAGFHVTPTSFVVRLKLRENSRPIAFQVVANEPGRRSLFVNAYQEDGALAAQTRLRLEVQMAVQRG